MESNNKQIDEYAIRQRMISKADEDLNQQEEVEDELSCTICLDIMYRPVTTECGHTFCKQCLSDALAVKKQCTICREPVTTDNLPVNITLQKILEKKYPDKIREKEKQFKKYMIQRTENENRVENMPVVTCESFIYPGMKTLMNVDTRQLRDLIHILT